MSQKTFDVIFAGGGLSNLLCAYRLKTSFPRLRMRVLEKSEKKCGHQTWSFFESDICDSPQGITGHWMEPFVAHRWKEVNVSFPAYSRTYRLAYASIVASGFFSKMQDILQDEIQSGIEVVELTSSHVRLKNGSRLEAPIVIDGLGSLRSPGYPCGYQKFVGLVLNVSQHPFRSPVVMDARVAQTDGYRFFYILPFDEHTLLVEDTYYSADAEMDSPQLRRGILDWCRARGLEEPQVLDEESGILPIPFFGAKSPQQTTGHARNGLAGGVFHPATGYSIADAVRQAEWMARAYGSLPEISSAMRRRNVQFWQSRGFYRRLNNMLFFAATAEQRVRVFEKFFQNREDLIARFFSGRLRFHDYLKILSGKPPVGVIPGLRAFFTQIKRNGTSENQGTNAGFFV